MRQIGDDYRKDPFKPIVTAKIGAPDALTA